MSTILEGECRSLRRGRLTIRLEALTQALLRVRWHWRCGKLSKTFADTIDLPSEIAAFAAFSQMTRHFASIGLISGPIDEIVDVRTDVGAGSLRHGKCGALRSGRCSIVCLGVLLARSHAAPRSFK